MQHVGFFSFFFFFSCRIWALVPWPGIEPRPPAVEAQSPYRMTREVPSDLSFTPALCLLKIWTLLYSLLLLWGFWTLTVAQTQNKNFPGSALHLEKILCAETLPRPPWPALVGQKHTDPTKPGCWQWQCSSSKWMQRSWQAPRLCMHISISLKILWDRSFYRWGNCISEIRQFPNTPPPRASEPEAKTKLLLWDHTACIHTPLPGQDSGNGVPFKVELKDFCQHPRSHVQERKFLGKKLGFSYEKEKRDQLVSEKEWRKIQIFTPIK